MSAPINAVVLGATGYVGGELLRLLALHPALRLAAAVSESRAGDPLSAVFPALAYSYPGAVFASAGTALENVDDGAALALFSAAPHGASAPAIASMLAAAAAKSLDVHVVDSSADFRYPDAAGFEAVYGIPHPAPALLGAFDCALPEHAATIEAPHIGHPGCFATAALLASVPLFACDLAEPEVFISGITGSTGSGRSPQPGTHHPERHGNLYAYKPLAHRHTPEIEALIGKASGHQVDVRFIPHSGPFARGIYITLQARLNRAASETEVKAAFDEYYAGSDFVHVVTGMPRLKDVVTSNHSHLGVTALGRNVVVTCAIDNLVKGAAGGAVQWMNRLWSLPETSGLTAPAPAWT